MEFYQHCLGGKLHLVTYAQMPGACDTPGFPKEAGSWIMHARLEVKEDISLMASDTRPDMLVTAGDNFFVSVQAENIEEAQKIFSELSQKGTIEMTLQETEWAVRFGMLTDHFGIKWMVNLDKLTQK
jgi:PhnB protein